MTAPIKADDLFAAWGRNQWKPAYLFAGQEDFLIEQAVRQAAEHWLGGDPAAMNRERFDGQEHGADEILEAARTVSFFGGPRLIRVDNAARLSPADQKRIAEDLPNLDRDTHLIFVWGREWRRDEARKPLVEAVAQLGQVVIFWPLFEESARRWVLERARYYGRRMAPDAAAWLVQEAGQGLRLLDQELLKCVTFAGDRTSIDIEDVKASFGYQKASSPFEWLAAIRGRQARQAAAILEHLLAEGEEAGRLLWLLSHDLREWLSAKGSGQSPTTLAMRLHARRGEENRIVQELSRWTEEELEEGIRRCLQADQSIKMGKETPEMALTLLTLSLCRFETAHLARKS